MLSIRLLECDGYHWKVITTLWARLTRGSLLVLKIGRTESFGALKANQTRLQRQDVN